MNKDLTETTQAGVPDWLKPASPDSSSFGNLDASDLKPPRLKLLAGQSPEIMNGVPDARVGQFWMTVLDINLGPQVQGFPIFPHKSYVMWAPKLGGSDSNRPLAVASDGIHWDEPNQKFEVQFPSSQGGGTYVWEIKNTVFENGLEKFGSSQPDIRDSKPAATLTYDILWAIELPNGSRQVCVFTNARTGATPVQKFLSNAKALRAAKGIEEWYQRFRIVSQKKTNKGGNEYFAYRFEYIDHIKDPKYEAEAAEMRALNQQYSKLGFVSDFEPEADAPAPSRPEIDDDIPF